MRVALLSRGAHPLHEPGGMERAVYHLAKHLSACGVEVVLVTRPATREGAFPGEVVVVPYGSSGTLRHGRVLDRTLRYPAFARRVGECAAALVRAARADIVHAHGLTALGYGRLRRRDRSLRAPLVMNPHGMEEHKARGLKRLALSRLRALSREAARLSDRVIATDEALREDVCAHLGVAEAKVVVLPNAVDLEEIAAATPEEPRRALTQRLPGLAAASPLLLSVGRLEAYKGFADVLAACARLEAQRRLPPAWALLIVGEGPRRAAIAAEARSLGLAQRVHLAADLDDRLLHAAYAVADVFVHATRYEGSSLVVLEAMAHALPVVATRAGGIPDKVVDGETGRLVAAGDGEGLAQALEELCGGAAPRRLWGGRGRALVRQRFAWPAVARRTLALYEDLLREARP